MNTKLLVDTLCLARTLLQEEIENEECFARAAGETPATERHKVCLEQINELLNDKDNPNETQQATNQG